MDQSTLEGAQGEHRIRSGHRIATQKESFVSTACEEAMQEKAVLAQSQNNFPRMDVFEVAVSDLDHVARPHRRQHALAADSQAQTAPPTQRVCSQG
jgi:hypothetical protein